MFDIDPEVVIVAADTLVSDADGQAVTYNHKIHELEGGICAVATGMANVLVEWIEEVKATTPPPDLDAIVASAPDRLAQIANDLAAAHGVDVHTTLYVFGLYGDTYAGFAFRAEDGYAAERLENGFFAKPSVPEVIQATPHEDAQGWIKLAVNLKAHEDANPVGQKVPIGGQLDLAMLMGGGVQSGTVYQLGG